MSPPTDETGPEAPPFEGPGSLDRALELVRFLRRACSWDRAQTAESLIPHLLEETHEVVDAIREGDHDALEGELGDLLLNLAFQIVVAEESGALDADTVYARLEGKMIARHPHLFEGGEHRAWEELKASEREAGTGVLEGVARGLDPLTKAFRMQERVAAVGFDWETHEGPAAKVAEELAEAGEAIAAGDAAAIEEEIGDLIFAAVNLARLVRVHPTTALARANVKFRERFERVEALARERGIEMSSAGLAALDALWDEVKGG